MKIDKKLGIWMDNHSAHIVDFLNINAQKKIIKSKFTPQEKEETLNKSENLMHHKEQHEQASYYKEIGEIILNYNHVILFGPTHAKSELHNLLKKDHHFDKIKIDVEQSNKMSDSEIHEFTQHYFSHCL